MKLFGTLWPIPFMGQAGSSQGRSFVRIFPSQWDKETTLPPLRPELQLAVFTGILSGRLCQLLCSFGNSQQFACARPRAIVAWQGIFEGSEPRTFCIDY